MRQRHDACGCGGKKRKESERCVNCTLETLLVTKAPKTSETFEVKGNAATFKAEVTEKIESPEDLYRICKIDLTIWEVVTLKCSGSQGYSIPRAVGKSRTWERTSTEPVITQLYHVSATLKRKVEIIGAREEVASLLEAAKRDVPVRKSRLVADQFHLASGRLLEIAIPDLHVGKLAWAPETGHGSYDVKLAKQAFWDALEILLVRSRMHGPFERILFTIGNDLLHADTLTGTTTKGTQLETDSRFPKAFTAARELMCEAIDTLRVYAPVLGVVVSGNHDRLSAWTLGHSLECYFRNTADVQIDNRPTLRKYVEFGNNLLMLTHGDKVGKQKLPLLMAREEPAAWGRTRNHEVHLGHLHQEHVSEYSGVRVRIIPSLSAADAYHAENGYVSQRAAEAFVWDREEGIIAHANYTIPSQRGEQRVAA